MSHMSPDTDLASLTGAVTNGNAAAPTSWPGGWYVFEDGRIQGPFSADAAFALPDKSLAGVPKLVSRKGFSQWYQLSELAELYKLSEKLGHRASVETEKLESEVAENLANLEVLRALAQTGADPSVIARSPRVSGKTIEAHVRAADPLKVDAWVESSSSSETKIDTTVIGNSDGPGSGDIPAALTKPSSPPSARKTLSRKQRKALARRMAAQSDAESNATGNESKGAEQVQVPTAPATQVAQDKAPAHSKKSNLSPRQMLMQEYLLLRGRLRLGEMRSPLANAFLLGPLTLFLNWGFWFKDLAREMVWHVRGTPKAEGMPPLVFAWVPVLHIYMTWRLAQLLREAEVQNGYKATSPMAAALFALIPPMAMAYLQDAANQHWKLHVRHSILERVKT